MKNKIYNKLLKEEGKLTQQLFENVQIEIGIKYSALMQPKSAVVDQSQQDDQQQYQYPYQQQQYQFIYSQDNHNQQIVYTPEQIYKMQQNPVEYSKQFNNEYGYYYESSDNQVDADGFNDNSSKKKGSQDKDQRGKLARINCTFKEALSKLYEDQKFEKAVFNAEGEYKQMIEQLLLYWEVLNDLINGSGIESQDISKSEVSIYLKIYQVFRVNLCFENNKQIKKNKKKNRQKIQNSLNSDQVKIQTDIKLQIIDEKELRCQIKKLE